ncbi:unnamed protein product [Cylicocyclus nassatus]|uniref:Aquaporin n=1 Tax=Cylicocyclus nassatus TaxID=53992 RepID=A0AA36HBF2_CYLNA|nr:unnamed protein product [Cylicocyclus nassatus]
MTTNLLTRLRSRGVKNVLLRNLVAEFVGTFLLVFIGTCNVAQFHLGRGKTTTWIGVNIGWGFALMFSVMATANTSGGHLNPAVSLLMWSFGHLPFLWVLLYSVAQTAGAFLAAACTYYFYYETFNHYDRGVRTVLGPMGTGLVFCSYPAPYIGHFTPYLDQIVGTAILCYFVCMTIDERNRIPKVWHPLIFGLLLIMIGTAYGVHLGYPINPARDLGPRLFSFLTHGSGVFSKPYPTYFLAPIIGPLIGALLGGWLYHVSVGMHLPAVETEKLLVGEQEQSLLRKI